MVTLFYPVIHVELYLLVVAIHICLASYVWYFRDVPGAKAQFSCLACKGIWLLSMVWASSSTVDLGAKNFAAGLFRAAMHLASFFWFLQIVQLSRQEETISVVVRRILMVLAVAIGFVVLTNPWHGLYWQTLWLNEVPVKGAPGPALAAINFVTILYCVLAMLFSLCWAFTAVGLHRNQALLYAAAGIVSTAGVLLDRFSLLRALEPLPLSFLLSGVMITWGFYRLRVYNILPLAQAAAVKNMTDGLVVVDEYGFIVEMNPAAKQALTGLSAATIGEPFAVLAAEWTPLMQLGKEPGLEQLEAMREHASGCRYYQLSMASLQTGSEWLGKVVLLKEITAQKEAQQKMLEQQKALSIMVERDRLGRELHDGTGQLWSYMHMQIEATRSFLDHQDWLQAGVVLEKLAGITRDIHIDLRESITGLKNSTLDGQGVWQTLSEYLQWFEQNYGIKSELLINRTIAAGLLSPTIEVQVLRIVQEALTNIRKYARAHKVMVIIRVNGETAEIRVEDDGCGFDPALAAKQNGHFGLKIMRERAAEISAQFDVQSNLGEGTKIVLRIPLEERKSEAVSPMNG